MNPTEFQAAILDLYNKACQGTNATEDAQELKDLARDFYANVRTALEAAGETPEVPEARIEA